MDRLSQLRGDAGASGDSTMDASSPPSEAFMTANESSSKYFSLSEVDSTFSISPTKDSKSEPVEDSTVTASDGIIPNLSPIPKSDLTYKIGDQIEAANILSGGVDIFDDNENSYDGDELVIDDAVTDSDDKAGEFKVNDSPNPYDKADESLTDTVMEDGEIPSPSKDTEVVLQIDGKNVDAIDIGNGLYLYRKEGEEELAAVQILDDNQQPNIKFLKVRENAEGNLEVYEEIEIEIPKEVPIKEGKTVQNTSRIPIKDKNKIIEPTSNKVAVKEDKPQQKIITTEVELDSNKDNIQSETNTEVNLNGKKMKFSESRKSPLIGLFTPMTYHSTPNKEGIPLTKTMVDLQLHPNRHFENVKKTIEVHTDNCKQRLLETPVKNNIEPNEHIKNTDIISVQGDKKEINDISIQPNLNEEDMQEDTLTEKKSVENVVEYNCDKNPIEEKTCDESVPNADIPIAVETTGNIVQSENSDMDVVATPSIDMVTECETTMDVEVNLNTKDTNVKEIVDEPEVEPPLEETAAPIINACLIPEAQSEVLVLECSENIENEVVIQKDNGEEVNENIINKEEEKKSDSLRIENDESDTTEKLQDMKSVDKPINTTNDIQKCELNSRTVENDLAVIIPNECISSDPKVNSNINIQNNSKPISDTDNNYKTITEDYVKNDFKEANKLVVVSSLNDVSVTSNTEIKIPEKTILKTSDVILENMITKTDSKLDLVKNINILDSDECEVVEMKIDTELKQSESNVMSDAEALLMELEDNEAILQKELEVRDRSRINNALIATISTDVGATSLGTQIVAVDTSKPKVNLTISDTKVLHTTANLKNIHQLSSVVVDSSKSDGKVSDKKENMLNFDHSNAKGALNAHTENPSVNKTIKSIDKAVCKTDSMDSKSISPISAKSVEQLCAKVTVSSSDDKIPHKTEKLKFIEPTSVKPVVSSVGVKKSRKPECLQEVTEKNDGKKRISNKVSEIAESKPVNESKPGVPFGKWTEINRQEFLSKFKESKAPPNTNSNTKQIKQANDLNRRDVLQKIDSQRQSTIASAKAQESNSQKLKQGTSTFVSKTNVVQKEKANKIKEKEPIKTEENVKKTEPDNEIEDKEIESNQIVRPIPVDVSNNVTSAKKEPVQRKEYINNQDLIDKTIEGIINRATGKLGHEEVKQNTDALDKSKNTGPLAPVSLDDIETKMNELHGIPFVERPPHELPQVIKSINVPEAPKTTKTNQITNLVTFVPKNSQNDEQIVKNSVSRPDEVSDEEIIEHEPITGDIEINKNSVIPLVPLKERLCVEEIKDTKVCSGNVSKEAIITENDFDKFARRNSVTYENRLTVNFDSKESHNVIQTVVEKEVGPKKMSRNEIMLAESKAKSNKNFAMRHNNFASKIPTSVKQPIATNDEETYNKNYQSKVQMAYQSVITAKRQQECPLTIIEDKPVKVVFMESNIEFTPHQLNVQGPELSPPKKPKPTSDWDNFMYSNSESLDSDAIDAGYDSKSQDEIKFKSKHQRKQVLTPVETPELELIEPSDLGIEVSPKKKRKLDDYKSEKTNKTVVPKKSYLLNRNITIEDPIPKPQDTMKTTTKETGIKNETYIQRTDPISAIDNLVKAAELLETQSENKNVLLSDNNSSSQHSTPVKRGRGRPRKYPIPETRTEDNKSPSPQKKPRLIDAKVPKYETDSDDSLSSDSEMIKENWTMGKINENIVCPICFKLFRSENVVFKHVKHCTGPSPNRSDSDKRSPRRMRSSQESESKSGGSNSDSDIEEDPEKIKPIKKKKSKDKSPSIDHNKEVIVIEDTPVKEIEDKRDKIKHEPDKDASKTKLHHRTNNNLVCEFCGKTFRQLSYLVNHKLQHKKDIKKTNLESKKNEKEPVEKSVFACEICNKEFRKLHHLVQHRNIHNPEAMPSRLLRKNSSEQTDNKPPKDSSKLNEDQSAGFRCEPCDKSFRKLHHLVEHRETHDEMIKKSVSAPVPTVETTKPPPVYNCEVCKKTFKKLQHLNEHKEQHLDTSSEKSDDKSVKSCLSTRDIIHECPLCYMVFPNEHSLTKHTIICQRKKKQGKPKQVEENNTEDVEEDVKVKDADEEISIIQIKPGADVCVVKDEAPAVIETVETVEIEKPVVKEVEIIKEIKPVVPDEVVVKDILPEADKPTKIKDENKETIEKTPIKVKSKKIIPPDAPPVEIIKIPDTPTPKKRQQAKDKIAPTVTKRQRTTNLPLPVVDSKSESSDDEEVRYMLNPDFKVDQTTEGKLFMKVRAQKRNSLQIERPSSQDLVKRRISLQHPPKIPRLKVKPIERRPINTNTVVKSSRATLKPILSSDSEDNDVKYSFPETVAKDVTLKEAEKKSTRKSVVEKRKSLTAIAKRKSLPKVVTKPKLNTSNTKTIKKRTTEAEHRCDCGQLFSSAALLSRHTTLAHTPPRIRRRRSPPPPPPDTSKPKPPKTNKNEKKNTKPDGTTNQKSGVATRKSSVSDAKALEARKAKAAAPAGHTRRGAAHRGVPVPDKMRKLMDKSKK